MKGKEAVRQLVHTPAEIVSGYVQWAERAQTNAGVPFGVPCIDKAMIPMKPGDDVSILGRPGDGKTAILASIARNEESRLDKIKADRSDIIALITWEQTAEELAALFMANQQYTVSEVAWGRVNLDTIRRQAVAGAGRRIWIIGHGIGRAGKGAPRMTPDVVLGAIESMQEDFGVRPVLLLFDYLQLIPVERAGERIQQVTEATIRIKEVAQRVGAPAVVAVQASREVDQRQVKLAEAYDAQWSSAIEQTSDKMFSLWRPARTQELQGKQIEMEDGTRHTVTDTLLLVRMLKQRFERGRQTWALHFDPASLHLAEREMRVIDDAY